MEDTVASFLLLFVFFAGFALYLLLLHFEHGVGGWQIGYTRTRDTGAFAVWMMMMMEHASVLPVSSSSPPVDVR